MREGHLLPRLPLKLKFRDTLRILAGTAMSSIDVIDRLTRRLFGSPILQNHIRGEVVEEIVASALEPEWQHCSGDWGPCDLRHPGSGLRIQLKQSAARQSWDAGEVPRENAHFSIAEKTGRYENDGTWVEEASRSAEIFIFAWHPLTDPSADHRRPDQWLFHVVPERDLSRQKSISLAAVRAVAPSVDFAGLVEAVGTAEARLYGPQLRDV
jgi:hypothetical protein